MFEQADVDQFNDQISAWSKETQQDLVNEINRLGVKRYSYSRDPLPLRQAIKSRVVQKEGMANRISYKMPRSAVFLHKGVSKSHPKTNPRQAKEWFNPVVERHIEELENIVADGSGSLVINALQIK